MLPILKELRIQIVRAPNRRNSSLQLAIGKEVCSAQFYGDDDEEEEDEAVDDDLVVKYCN